MALTLSQHASGNSTASSATLDISVTAAVGDMLVIVIGADNAGTNGASSISSVSDAAGNTWAQRALNNQDPGAANAGATLGIYTTIVTSALSAQDVTVNFSPNTGSKAAVIWKAVPGSGERMRYLTAGAGATGNGTTQTITSGTVENGDTIIGGIAAERNSTVNRDTDTSNGSWSAGSFSSIADTGTAATSMLAQSQAKTVTAAATQTYNGTTGGSIDYAINYIVIDTVPFIDAGTGSYAITGTAATPKLARKIAAAAGAYAISGTVATVKHGWKVTADAGSYAINGADVTLTIAPAAGNYFTVADAGSYTLTGTAASPLLKRRAAADAGSYAITGTAATPKLGRTVVAEAGSYALSGSAGSLLRTYQIAALAGSYAINGAAAATLRGWKVTVGDGAYVITGTSVQLVAVAPGPGFDIAVDLGPIEIDVAVEEPPVEIVVAVQADIAIDVAVEQPPVEIFVAVQPGIAIDVRVSAEV